MWNCLATVLYLVASAGIWSGGRSPSISHCFIRSARVVAPSFPLLFMPLVMVAVVIWRYSTIRDVIPMPASSMWECMAAFGVEMERLQHFFAIVAIALTSDFWEL